MMTSSTSPFVEIGAQYQQAGRKAVAAITNTLPEFVLQLAAEPKQR